MKKLLLSLILMPMLMLTACGNSNPQYETYIYCTTSYPCDHCKSWSAISDDQLKTAYSITCTDLTHDSYHPHYHYVVTWIKEGK